MVGKEGKDCAGVSQACYVSTIVEGTKHPRLIPSSLAAGDRDEFSPEEVALHNTEHDAWTIYDGEVYDMTPYIKFHPGGKAILLEHAAGQDCTHPFQTSHPYVSIKTLLGKFKLGKAKKSKTKVNHLELP
eukprot:GHVH01004795.1.p1 GENE.GHVH01004795.1~~GHVH01004795.1.p1  ORF type:complete len:130 (+),score=6.75 GHVH01004795.1:33-422(+)